MSSRSRGRAAPSPALPSRAGSGEGAKSPRLQKKGSSKGKLQGMAHVPCPLSGQGVPPRWMSAWLASPQDTQWDERPSARDPCCPRSRCQSQGIPEPSPAPCPLPALVGDLPAAALSPGAALMGGPKQAAAGLCQHSRRGGREITEEFKKNKRNFLKNGDYAKINQEKQPAMPAETRWQGENALCPCACGCHQPGHGDPQAGAIPGPQRPPIYCHNHPAPRFPCCTRWGRGFAQPRGERSARRRLPSATGTRHRPALPTTSRC